MGIVTQYIFYENNVNLTDLQKNCICIKEMVSLS